MAYRNKTYVAFDGDSDIRYYSLMKAWKQNDNSDFIFYDAHDLNNALDTSTEETIKRRLRERMENSKVFVLLVGKHTKNLRRPYVRCPSGTGERSWGNSPYSSATEYPRRRDRKLPRVWDSSSRATPSLRSSRPGYHLKYHR
jgi:hypothetical protein